MPDQEGEVALPPSEGWIAAVQGRFEKLAERHPALRAHLWVVVLPVARRLSIALADEAGRVSLGRIPAEVELERASLLGFVDYEPGANWEHDCEFWFFDAQVPSAEPYRKVRARRPPFFHESGDPAGYRMLVEKIGPGSRTPCQELRSADRRAWPPAPPAGGRRKEWFAILFSGTSNYRHVNDLEFLYRALVCAHGVPSENIYVLNYDGTLRYRREGQDPLPGGPWPGDGTPYRMAVRCPGSQAALWDVAQTVGERIGTELCGAGKVLVHTSNHGGRLQGGVSSLLSYSNIDKVDIHIDARTFASELCPRLGEVEELHVVMEQCYAGGMVEPLLQHSHARETTVSVACLSTHTSAGDAGGCFDPYAHDWISAFGGRGPGGGSLHTGKHVPVPAVGDVVEAFAYAAAVRNRADTPYFSRFWSHGVVAAPRIQSPA